MQPVKLGNPSAYYKTIKFLLQSETRKKKLQQHLTADKTFLRPVLLVS